MGTYSFNGSYGNFKFINVGLAIIWSKADEEMGLDTWQHNEKYFQGTLLVRHNGNGALTEEEKGIAETINFWEKLISYTQFLNL